MNDFKKLGKDVRIYDLAKIIKKEVIEIGASPTPNKETCTNWPGL